MITPTDIQKKEFAKSVRGYNIEEVDMFLDLVTLDYEKMMKENAKLKTDIESLQGDLEKYKGSEGEVVKVLEQAKQLMGDISVSAEKRAKILLKNAELDADLKVREARDKAERLREENRNLKSRYINFRDKYKKMLEDELYRFENLTEDMYPDQPGEDKLEEILESSDIPERIETPARENKDETMVAGFDEEFSNSEPAAKDTKTDMDDRKTVIMNLKSDIGK